MLRGKILDCSWKEFEEFIKEVIGSDFFLANSSTGYPGEPAGGNGVH